MEEALFHISENLNIFHIRTRASPIMFGYVRVCCTVLSSETEHQHIANVFDALQFNKEELLAIMQGTPGQSASTKTLHHIQKINQHLNSVAKTAPALIAGGRGQGGVRKISAGRLLSDPGTKGMGKEGKGKPRIKNETTLKLSTTNVLVIKLTYVQLE